MNKRKIQKQDNDRESKRSQSDNKVDSPVCNLSEQSFSQTIIIMNDKGTIDNNTKHRLDQQVDFVERLPYEILPILLNEFDTRERLQLLDVSRTWRSRFTSNICSKVWSEIAIGGGDYLLSKINLIAHYVVDLSLIYVEDNDLINQIYMQMASGIFTKLKAFSVIGCMIECNASLQFALSNVADTLKELVIDDQQQSSLFSPMPLKIILSMCQNLEKFHYTHRQIFMLSGMMGILYSGTINALPLTDLTISVGDVDPFDVEMILQRCPELRILTLHGCHKKISYQIHHYCPKLEYLTIKRQSERLPFYELPPLPSKTVEKNKNGRGGLRFLSIGVEFVEDMVHMLTIHGQTLESLRVQFRVEEDRKDVSKIALRELIRMPNVQFLSIMDAQTYDADILVTLFQNLSNRVTHIYFDGCNLSVDEGAILDAIKDNFNQLEDLIFYDTCNTHYPALIRLLDNFTATNSLKSFYCDTPSDIVMDAITNIPSLSHIAMDLVNLEKEMFTQRGFLGFCHKLRIKNRPLNKVSFECLQEHVLDEGIKLLRGIKTIKSLEVNGEQVLHKSSS